MPWNGATGAIVRCKRVSTGCGRKRRSAHAWRWICGVKPKPKAVNKPSPHFIVHGLDKPGVFTTVSEILPKIGCDAAKTQHASGRGSVDDLGSNQRLAVYIQCGIVHRVVEGEGELGPCPYGKGTRYVDCIDTTIT